jgi:hypothetical protein
MLPAHGALWACGTGVRAPVVGVTRIDDTRLQPEAGVAVTMSIQPSDSGAAPVANALVPPEAMTGNIPANC